MLRPTLIALFLVPAAAAQTLFVVDGRNRPGTSFPDLPAAEAAAVDGDVIRLRADGGNYTAIQTGKALTIVGDLGPAFIRSTNGLPFRISGIAAGRQFTMADVMISGVNLNGPVLEVQGCAGRVLLQKVEVTIGAPSVLINGCAGVLLQEGRLLGGFPSLRAIASTLAITSLQTNGGAAHSPTGQASSHALELHQCTAVLDGVQASGGLGATGFAPSPALRLFNSSLRVGTGGGLGSLRAGPTGTSGLSAAVAVGSNSSMEVQTGLPVAPTGAAPVAQGVTVVTANFPSLAGHEWQTLPRAFFSFTGVPGAMEITVIGLPAGPITVPGISGQLWIDTQVFIPVLGVLPAIDLPLPVGINALVQIVSVAPSGAVALSGPVAIVPN